MTPKVLVVTRIPFWLLGAGERMRLLALMWVLSSQTRLTLLFLGPIGQGDLLRIAQLKVNCVVHGLPTVTGGSAEFDKAAESLALSEMCLSQCFEVCIFERIALHHLLIVLPPGIKTVLDTHDLESGNAQSREALGIKVSDAWRFEEELAVLAQYDRVLLIQREDHAKVVKHLGQRAMLVPHPVNFAALPVQANRRSIGMVASAWKANLDGLDWFADAVWPFLTGSHAQMHLFGWVGGTWRPGFTGFVRHGFVTDFKQAWGTVDVAINPVRWGSGLKIKSVEALGHGLPLVTTSEGARGMMAAAGQAFWVADTAEGFAKACATLLDEPERRSALGAHAHAYAKQHFSPQACFGELVQWLHS